MNPYSSANSPLRPVVTHNCLGNALARQIKLWLVVVSPLDIYPVFYLG